MEFTKLNNGIEMPMSGIGTFLLTPNEAETAATFALKNGFQLIDTANAYCNEKAVGRKDNFDIFDFKLTDNEMSALDCNKKYYTSTPKLLKQYAEMVPPVDEEK